MGLADLHKNQHLSSPPSSPTLLPLAGEGSFGSISRANDPRDFTSEFLEERREAAKRKGF